MFKLIHFGILFHTDPFSSYSCSKFSFNVFNQSINIEFDINKILVLYATKKTVTNVCPPRRTCEIKLELHHNDFQQ